MLNGQGLTGATNEALQDFYATFKTTFDAGDRDWIATWKQDPEAFNASWANWSVQDRDLALKVSDVMADVADFASVCISQGYEQLCDSPESIEDVMDELEDSADSTLNTHWKAVFDQLATDADDDEDVFEEVIIQTVEGIGLSATAPPEPRASTVVFFDQIRSAQKVHPLSAWQWVC